MDEYTIRYFLTRFKQSGYIPSTNELKTKQKRLNEDIQKVYQKLHQVSHSSSAIDDAQKYRDLEYQIKNNIEPVVINCDSQYRAARSLADQEIRSHSKHQKGFSSNAVEAVYKYLLSLNQAIKIVDDYITLIEALLQNLSTTKNTGYYCSHCRTYYTTFNLLSHIPILKGRGIRESQLYETLSVCPKCKGKLQDARSIIEPRAVESIVFPVAPVRIESKVYILPPLLPDTIEPQLKNRMNNFIKRRMEQFAHRLSGHIVYDYVKRATKSERMARVYNDALLVAVDNRNIINVGLSKGLARKIEFGKRKYPLWNTIKLFHYSKKGGRYVNIPFEVQFGQMVTSSPQKRTQQQARKVVRMLKQRLKVVRENLELREKATTEYVDITLFPSTNSGKSKPLRREGKTMFFEDLPDAEKIRRQISKKLNVATMKRVSLEEGSRIMRESTIKKVGGRLQEIRGGLVWFRRLSEKTAGTKFIIPDFPAVNALDFIAKIGYEEVEKIIQDMKREPEFSSIMNSIHTKHEVISAIGGNIQRRGDLHEFINESDLSEEDKFSIEREYRELMNEIQQTTEVQKKELFRAPVALSEYFYSSTIGGNR